MTVGFCERWSGDESQGASMEVEYEEEIEDGVDIKEDNNFEEVDIIRE